MANYDYSILGHQISVNAYNIVDRCEVCHAGIREPLDFTPEDLGAGGPGKKPDSWRARLSVIPTEKFCRFTIRKSLVAPVVTGATVARPPAMKGSRPSQVLALADV
jgi:hypothetical protein